MYNWSVRVRVPHVAFKIKQEVLGMAVKREVDVNKMAIVEEYAKAQEDLTAYVVGLGFNMTGNTMSCPFHGSDSTPSMKINGPKWKCFGCGRGGGYLKFRHELELLENHRATYYEVLDKYIMEHRDLAAMVDGTVFKSVEESFTEQWDNMMDIASNTSYKPKTVEVKSIDKLIRKAKKLDTATKIHLLSGIQEELPYPVLESIVNGTDLTGKSLLDLAGGF